MPNEREIEIARLVKFPENRDDLARLLKDYRLDLGMNRAELTAPAEGDVEAATQIISNTLFSGGPLPDLDDPMYPVINLRDKIAAALTTARKAEREKAASELHRYQKALDGLTIAGGGSNMHGDPEYQAKWVQERVNRHMDTAKRFAIERNNARARVEVLEAAAGDGIAIIRTLAAILTHLGYNREALTANSGADRLIALLAGEGKGEEERPTGIPDEIVSFFPDDSVPKEEVE